MVNFKKKKYQIQKHENLFSSLHLHVWLRRAAWTAVPIAVDVVQGTIEVFMDGLQEATGGIIDQSRVT